VSSTSAVHGSFFGEDRAMVWWGVGELRFLATRRRIRWIGALWLLAVVVSIATAVANVAYGWNGLELSLFGLPVDVTLYPPFLISVLLVLWLGPTWAVVPIYLANLTSALVSGMPAEMSALFALAGVIETLMLWATLVLLRVDPDLPRWRDAAWFAGAGLVAAVTGSLAAILWNSSHGLDVTTGQRVWRGWVIGDLAQILLLMPLLWLFGRKVRGWIDRHFISLPHREFSYTYGVALVVAAFAVLGLVVFLGVHEALASIEVTLADSADAADLMLPRLREIVLVMALLSVALIVATGMFSTALARMGERQRRSAELDPLTGCFNRRSFAELLVREAERSRRLGVGVGLLFLDLDRFKSINDRYGHAAGDAALIAASRRISAAMRQTDLVFRWGGEEFVVLLPHTSGDEVAVVAERVRRAVAEVDAQQVARLIGPEVRLAVSVGTAWTGRHPVDPEELVTAADAACYRAKAAGGDRVEAA